MNTANVYNVDALRAKLTQPDEYQKQLERQNNGEPCKHCDSSFGHRRHCPLINRQSAEAASFTAGNYSEADRVAAHGLGVVLEAHK